MVAEDNDGIAHRGENNNISNSGTTGTTSDATATETVAMNNPPPPAQQRPIISPSANGSTAVPDPNSRRIHRDPPSQIELENERLQKEVEAMKKLQRLKKEQEELKQWLAHPTSAASSNTDSPPNEWDEEFFTDAPAAAAAAAAGGGGEFTSLSLDEEQNSPSLPPSSGRGSDPPQLGGGSTSFSRSSSLERGSGLRSRKKKDTTRQGSVSHPVSTTLGFANHHVSTTLGFAKHHVSTTVGFAKDRYNSIKRRFRGGNNDSEEVDVEKQSSRSISLSISLREMSKNGSRSVKSVPIKELLDQIVAAVLTNVDDETFERGDTPKILIIVTLLKEAILGIVFAFVAVSFFLFLDHSFVLGLPMARNFRKATSAMMHDENALMYYEENSGLKFLDMNHFESIEFQTSKAENKTNFAQKVLLRSKDSTQMQKEVDVLDIEAEALMIKLGLDRFCGDCEYSEGMTCSERVSYLREWHTQTPKFKAMMSAMKKWSCRSNTPIAYKSSQREEALDAIFKRPKEKPIVSKKQPVKSVTQPVKTEKQPIKSKEPIKSEKQPIKSKEPIKSEKPIKSETPIKSKEPIKSETPIKSKEPIKGEKIWGGLARGEVERGMTQDYIKAHWDKLSPDFCGVCLWDQGTTCAKRSEYLVKTYGSPTRDAMSTTMADSERCTSSYYENKIRNMGGFCGKCQWGAKNMQTCHARVEYLTYTYRNPVYDAKLAAMEKESCRGEL